MGEKLKINNIEVVEVTELRIGFGNRKEGVHYYDIRSYDNNPFDIVSIEKSVWANHTGTIGLKDSLRLGEGNPYYEPTDEEKDALLKALSGGGIYGY